MFVFSRHPMNSTERRRIGKIPAAENGEFRTAKMKKSADEHSSPGSSALLM